MCLIILSLSLFLSVSLSLSLSLTSNLYATRNIDLVSESSSHSSIYPDRATR